MKLSELSPAVGSTKAPKRVGRGHGSGTGKTSLPYAVGKFLQNDAIITSIQPSWRDRSELFGYFNEFTKRYNETELLRAMYEATYNENIYLTILYEMNIARVEYYFAEMLSILEMPNRDEWVIEVVASPWETDPKRIVHGKLKIPANTWYIGTINNDDSTFAVADKVYDRAITLDFDSYNDPFEVSEEVGEIHLSGSGLRALYEDALKNSDNKLDEEDLGDEFFSLNKIFDFVYTTFDLAVGNRIINQIKTIVPVFMACGGSKEDALDLMLSRKLFAKLEGRFEEYVKPALKDCVNLLNRVYGKGVMKRCEKVINKISRSL